MIDRAETGAETSAQRSQTTPVSQTVLVARLSACAAVTDHVEMGAVYVA